MKAASITCHNLIFPPPTSPKETAPKPVDITMRQNINLLTILFLSETFFINCSILMFQIVFANTPSLPNTFYLKEDEVHASDQTSGNHDLFSDTLQNHRTNQAARYYQQYVPSLIK